MNKIKGTMIRRDLKISLITLGRFVSLLVILTGIIYGFILHKADQGVIIAILGVIMVSYIPRIPPESIIKSSNIKLFLDSSRIPAEDGWVVVRNYDEFKEVIERWYERIEVISFGDKFGHSQKSNYSVLSFLHDYIMDHPHLDSPLKEIRMHCNDLISRDKLLLIVDQMRKTIPHLHDLEIHDTSQGSTVGFSYVPEGFLKTS